MIISHKHKFIFLHARKCAGTTMEIIINKYLGPNDIQIGSWVETLANSGNFNKKAIKNSFFSISALKRTYKKLISNTLTGRGINLSNVINTSIKQVYKDRLGPNPASSSAEMVKDFDPKAWNNYFKFAFVRNPFEFEISDYFWRTKNFDKKIEFKDFLKRKLFISEDPENLVPSPPTNWPIYSINNKLVLDHIGQFEDLNNHISIIEKHIGLKLDISNYPVAKKGAYNASSAKNLYDLESIEMVRTLHHNELKFFKYNYPF